MKEKIKEIIDSKSVLNLCFKDGKEFNLTTTSTHAIFAINNPGYGKKFITLTKQEFNNVLLNFNILSGNGIGYVKEKMVTSENGNDYKIILKITKTCHKSKKNENNFFEVYGVSIEMEVAEQNGTFEPLGFNKCFFYANTFEELLLEAASNLNQSTKIKEIKKVIDLL